MAGTAELKIGVMGATLETPNLGVSTLATGAVSCILHAYPGARVFFLDYSRKSTLRKVPLGSGSVCVPLVNMRFSKRFWLPNNILVLLLASLLLKLVPSEPARRWLAGKNQCLKEIRSADLFTAISGGDSFSDIYGWVRFVYSALPQLLVILLGKRLVLLPQTYGPFRSKAARATARWIVAHSERSWCRDQDSLAQLMQVPASDPAWGDHATAYDLGFAVDPVQPSHVFIDGLSIPIRHTPNLAGVNISGLLFQGGYTGKNEFGLRSNYRRLVYAIVHSLLAHEEAMVLLVPHVSGAETGSESDVTACEQVFSDLRERYPGRIGILRGSYDPSEMRYIIGLCGFFVGSRMHACIAAIEQKVPAVAVAYSDKFTGVMRTVGIDSLVADARKLTRDEILASIRRAWESRQQITARLERNVPAIKRATLNLLNSAAVPDTVMLSSASRPV